MAGRDSEPAVAWVAGQTSPPISRPVLESGALPPLRPRGESLSGTVVAWRGRPHLPQYRGTGSNRRPLAYETSELPTAPPRKKMGGGCAKGARPSRRWEPVRPFAGLCPPAAHGPTYRGECAAQASCYTAQERPSPPSKLLMVITSPFGRRGSRAKSGQNREQRAGKTVTSITARAAPNPQ
jgi:hypothetical protein